MTVGLDTPRTLAAASTGALARASEIEAELALPAPASRSVALVSDRDTGQQVSEVVDLDPAGSPTAISRFDPAGRLLSLVRLGFGPQTSQGLGSAQASQRASSILASLGLAPASLAPAGLGLSGLGLAGLPAVTPRATGGWLVRWVRLVGAVPVPGDGISIQLAADGSFHALVRTEHRLAQAPAVALDVAYVKLLAEARLDTWFAAGVRGDAAVGQPGLAWVAPNDTFGDAVPPDSVGVVRLAWLIRVTTSGSLAEQVAGIELAFDAGDGTALGGDLLE